MNSRLNQVQQEEHSHCVLCGQDNEQGLKLDFTAGKDGRVEASFQCSPAMQGYRNVLHGGVVSALLDGAMTNCLFAHGIRALTADLKVRFLLPVQSEGPVRLQAAIERSWSRFYVLNSELYQRDVLKATARAIFVRFEKTQALEK